jgi:Flp pilus assembly pilin Flp
VYNLFDHPMVAFTMAYVRTRLEPLRERSERGASALETAIISAVLIAAAVLIGKIVIDKVNGAGDTVKNEQIPTAPGG